MELSAPYLFSVRAGKMSDCRLIVDRPATGSWNMAVDEALLAEAAEKKIATLRFYQWSEPTLSLGYFQRYAERHAHQASRHVTVVRRSSGGGAILHDRELTYSLALPTSHPLASHPQNLYQAVHRSLVQVLTSWLSARDQSLAVEMCPNDSRLPQKEQPFLCFERRACGDILLRQDKIAGSAQRRHHGAILQHGSILLAQSPAAPTLPGIRELANNCPLTPDELIGHWQEPLRQSLQVDFQPQKLPTSVASCARQIEQAKYALPAWTQRR